MLEKRDNPYPNLEDMPLYAPNDELTEVLFAEQFTAISGQFVFCEDEVDFIENLLELAEERNWRKIYCWEPALQQILEKFEYPFFETDKDFEQADVGFTLMRSLNCPERQYPGVKWQHVWPPFKHLSPRAYCLGLHLATCT